MPTMTQTTPENVLLATLHKVGQGTRLVDNFDLARVFDEAARQMGEPFKQFAWHRHYHVSDLLSATLQVLDHSGSIVRENAAQTYFRVSPHTAGPYGEHVFKSLSPQDQNIVQQVAERIKMVFGGPNDTGGSG